MTRLYTEGVGFRNPADARDFYVPQNVDKGSVDNSASYATDIGGFTGGLRVQGVQYTRHLHLPTSCTFLLLNAFIILMEERKLRVFENMVLRRIYGPRRDEVTGEWRRLHNEELNDLYSSPNIVRVIKSKRMRWAGHVARMGDESGAYSFLVGKPEGKGPLGRPRRRWVDNVKMYLREVGCEVWTGSC